METAETRSVSSTAEFVQSAMSGTLNKFKASLLSKFALLQTTRELEELISVIQEEARDTFSSTKTLVVTASALSDWYDLSGYREYLDLAIEITRSLIESLGADVSADQVLAIYQLAADLTKRYQLDGNIEELELAIKLCDFVIESDPSDKSSQLLLGNALHLRYQKLGLEASNDLDRSICILDELRMTTTEDSPSRATYEMNLASALISRYELLVSIDDLNAAIDVSKSCIKRTPKGSRKLPARLNTLCGLLISRFETLGMKPDLDRAIVLLDQALNLEPARVSTKRNCANNLSGALRRRYELTGSEKDLDRGLALSESLIAETPEKSPDRILYLNTYASCLKLTFNLTGHTDILRSAISTLEPTIPLIVNHPYESMLRITLGNALTALYERTDSIDDLNRAIDFMKNAPAFSSVRNDPNYHHSLANALLKRFESQKKTNDINDAVTSAETALKELDEHHPNRAAYLNTLSTALLGRKHENDSRNALKASSEAIQLTPESHPNWAVFQFNLGRAFQRLGETEDIETNLEQAAVAYENATLSESAAPAIRIMSAIECVNLISRAQPIMANQILRTAVEQLPLASPRTLERIDQQYTLSKFSGLASAAAALALDAGEPVYEAIRLLELGRGVMTSFQLDARTETKALEEQYSDLANTFIKLRDQIDAHPYKGYDPSNNDGPQVLQIGKSIQRNALLTQFKSIVAKIQTKKGFETFLQGPSLDDLTKLAEPGPIVFLSVSETRCDALIMRSSCEPSVLPLPTNMKEVSEKANVMKGIIKDLKTETYLDAVEELRATLVWMWKGVVGPVLDLLGFQGSSKHDAVFPRIWWIPCGPFSYLPIHAAGDHKKKSVRNTLDCVISSYSPTARLLAYARERAAKPIAEPQVQVISTFIAMPETPGKTVLPNVEKEIEIIEKFFPIKVLMKPTKKEVLSALELSYFCIFGCHGESEDSNPSQSRLLLEDWERDTLTVADIANLKLKHSQFAYLSACHSADNPNLDLLDESIHLTAAFQVAGFSHVVGNLWEVRDLHSTVVMEGIVNSLTDKGDNHISFDKIAVGLHERMKELRDSTRRVPGLRREFPPDPLVWAPYIYMGA